MRLETRRERGRGSNERGGEMGGQRGEWRRVGGIPIQMEGGGVWGRVVCGERVKRVLSGCTAGGGLREGGKSGRGGR